MKVNRVLIVAAVVLILATIYEVKLKPQSRPLYDRALTLYRQERYAASLLELERAYQIEPNSTAILVLRGWNFLKLRQYNDAREDFSRASRLNPKLIEPQLGLAYVALESGKGEAPLAGIKALLEKDPRNDDFQLATAVALRQTGHNLEAQPIFQRFLGRSRYGSVARKNLEEMYGIEGTKEPIPQGLPPLNRPNALRIDFQAKDRYLQRRAGNGWENFYVKGVDLGPATPGYFASEPPNLVEIYEKWLEQIAQLGANVVRVYAVLPPSFYRAFKRHNDSNPSKLYLLQQVWLVGAEQNNLFASGVGEDARKDIAHVIDLLHGQGDVPQKKGQAGGVYVVDVSEWVLGLLVGRELEPHLVVSNNELNSFRKSYQGKYVRAENANATEVWLAEMLDYTAAYEEGKYNQQRPLSVVNWAPLDPLSHPTEAGLVDELKFRKRIGERTGGLPQVFDDEDAVSLDETHFRPQSAFQAGLFVSYSVYPFSPDFLLNDPVLLQAKDQAGPNSFFGYLKALKAQYSALPLLVVEYGIPSSIGVAHFHPLGWNQGGLNEREQGEFLARMTRNIADAGCAGGIVYEWQDEWSKTIWLTAPFEVPEERRALWLDPLNPRENFGLWTYDTSRAGLFSSDTLGWRGIKPLYEKSLTNPAYPLSDGADTQRTLRSLTVSSDEAFLYLRLAVQSLPRGPDGAPQLDKANYLIGISTRPGSFGGRIVPALMPQVRYPEGFNFLLHVAGTGDKTKLLIASNYDPFELAPVEGVSSRTHLGLRRSWKPALEDWTPFEEMTVETNRMRFSKDGTLFSQRRYSRSVLRYGPLDSNSPQYDSVAIWSADFPSNSLIFRLPWGMLYVTDPSSRQVYSGTATENRVQVQALGTDGLGLFALSFRPAQPPPDLSRFPAASLPVTDSLPGVDSQGTLTRVQKYRWEEWNSVKVNGHLRASTRALQKSFRELKIK